MNTQHPDQIKAWIQSWNPKALLMNGFDAALVGSVARADFQVVAVYDRTKCIEILMNRDEMSAEDADEFFSFNCEGAYMGAGTPVIGCFDFSDINLEEAQKYLSEQKELHTSEGEE
jgi:hypothetical protein|tara:strand:- start:177 stop:524 length:348 start_codon:yes stop_codon:yes gene_type:complete